MRIYACVYTHFLCNSTYIFFVCNRFNLNKICLCCFFDKHLCSKNLSIITTFSLLNISELFPACLSCSNNFNWLHSWLGSDGNFFVEIPGAMIACELRRFIRDFSLGLFRPFCLLSVFFFFQAHIVFIYPVD